MSENKVIRPSLNGKRVLFFIASVHFSHRPITQSLDPTPLAGVVEICSKTQGANVKIESFQL